ncbi:MAG: ABC-type multidrug transport system, ATPase component [Deltaproteobacteria bacterium]|nr:ABC-type multidrug transport system, ATPase component [Deltaproteobacteria bacterium]
METQTVIQTTGLTKRYDHQTAVDRLNFQVMEGEIFGFLGPNGAGKTTTLLMLLGLSRPSEGGARVCGLDPERKAMEVKRIVGYLPENVGFYGDMDAVQSLRYVADLNRIPVREAEDRIHEVLKLVGLMENGGKKVSAFSRGMKQRLGIAEVLLKDPKVMFLDEPTLGLDPDGAVRLIELIQSLNQERKITVLLSSHHLQQVQKISHRVGIMIKGRMVAEGSIDALAREKFGVGEEKFTLEEIYMKYFQEV